MTCAVFVFAGSEEESGVWELVASPSLRCYTGARMDKPLIGYRAHHLPCNSTRNVFVWTVPQLPAASGLWAELKEFVLLISEIIWELWMIESCLNNTGPFVIEDQNIWEPLGNSSFTTGGEKCFSVFFNNRKSFNNQRELASSHAPSWQLVGDPCWVCRALMKRDSICASVALLQDNLIYLRGTHFTLLPSFTESGLRWQKLFSPAYLSSFFLTCLTTEGL